MLTDIRASEMFPFLMLITRSPAGGDRSVSSLVASATILLVWARRARNLGPSRIMTLGMAWNCIAGKT